METSRFSDSNTRDNKDYLDTKIGRFNKDISVATIYIGNLDYDLCEFDILDLFEEFGYVSYVKLVKDPVTHESKGIAFVQMAHMNQAKAAIKNLNDSSFRDRIIKVSIAEEKDDSSSAPKIVKKRRKPYKAYVSKAQRAIIAE